MSSKVRWGVAGAGGIARRRTIPEGIAAAENAELRAVCANAEVAREFGAKACTSLDELLASGIDAVYIASPVYRHIDQALACFAAGKHVLCEKPFGRDGVEAVQIVRAAEAAGKLLGAAFMMRFQSQHREALRLIREGRIGRPVFARAQLSCWYPKIEGAWRQDPALGGGGSLIDLGSHLIDLLEMFFGPVERVSCFTHSGVQDYAVEDSAAALLAFENGATATIDAFFCIPDAASRNVLELYGSQGAILAANTIGQGEAGEMTLLAQEECADYRAAQDRAIGAGTRIAPPPVNAYRAEIEDFSRAVLEGARPAAGAAEGLRNQRILDACYESARTGCTVRIA